MEWHFGYNCKHYLPTLNKCRILIDNYRERSDLITDKWISTKELLVYLNLPNSELIEQITNGKIKTKLQKDSKLKIRKRMFQVSSSWQWDDCFHVDSGGQCLYYEPHDGYKITCLKELKGLTIPHPNLKNVPSDHDIEIFEHKVSIAIREINNVPHNNLKMNLI